MPSWNTKNECLSLINWPQQDSIPEPDNDIDKEDSYFTLGLPCIDLGISLIAGCHFFFFNQFGEY